jgi:hypothetical protein
MGGGGKGGGSQETTQSSAPWAGVQPHLMNLFGAAGDWFGGPTANISQATPMMGGGPISFDGGGISGGLSNVLKSILMKKGMGQQATVPYEDRTAWMDQPMVAGPSPETTEAWEMGAERARAGSPLTEMAKYSIAQGMGGVNPAMALFAPTATGQMFDPAFNKQWGHAAEQMGQQFRDVALPSIASRFSMAGRTGSGMEKEMTERAMGQFGESLGGLAADIYGQERGRQMQAIGGIGGLYGQDAANRLRYAMAAPSMAGLDYADIGQLANIGAQKQAYQQQLIDAPMQRLGQYASLLQPGLGFGTQAMKEPLHSNPMASAAGGAMMGAQMGGPYGALAGGGIGYLSGKA